MTSSTSWPRDTMHEPLFVGTEFVVQLRVNYIASVIRRSRNRTSFLIRNVQHAGRTAARMLRQGRTSLPVRSLHVIIRFVA